MKPVPELGAKNTVICTTSSKQALSIASVALLAALLVSFRLRLAALALVVAPLALFLLFRPRTLLLMVAALAPLAWLPGLPQSLYSIVRDLLFLAYFLSVALLLFRQRRQVAQVSHNPLLWLLVLLLITLLPSVALSSNPVQSAIVWLRLSQVVLFYTTLLIIIRNSHDADAILLAYTLGNALSVLVACSELLFPGLAIIMRDASPFPSGLGLAHRDNNFANITAVVLPVMLTHSFLDTSRYRSGWQLLLFLSFLAVALSGGRAGLLAAMLVGMLFLYRRVGAKKVFAVTLSLVAFAFTFGTLNPSADPLALVTDRLFVQSQRIPQLKNLQGLQKYDRLLASRLSAYARAVELGLQHPLTGVGLGRYADAAGGVEDFTAALGLYEKVARHAHNIYLNMLAEGGLLPGSITVIFMLLVLRKGLQAYQQSARAPSLFCALLIILATIVVSLFELRPFLAIYSCLPFWFAVALLHSRPPASMRVSTRSIPVGSSLPVDN